MSSMFGRIYKTRFFFACVILIALTCLIRNSFWSGDRILVNEIVAESTIFTKAEFAQIAQLDKCPVCFGQDMCKDLAKNDLEISR